MLGMDKVHNGTVVCNQMGQKNVTGTLCKPVGVCHDKQ